MIQDGPFLLSPNLLTGRKYIKSFVLPCPQQQQVNLDTLKSFSNSRNSDVLQKLLFGILLFVREVGIEFFLEPLLRFCFCRQYDIIDESSLRELIRDETPIDLKLFVGFLLLI